ncbi:KRAB-A domain-containing protein 2-like [Macrobrachium nipponense]|uniref:KRAB-A domain-containing protein 2-like n=1 Tax=Macrobrachium nipponense TaxID=159736 RepID=UPI0030C861BD
MSSRQPHAAVRDENCPTDEEEHPPPVEANSMNSRAQVDLIDMQSQPDGKTSFILKLSGSLDEDGVFGLYRRKLLKRLLSTSLIYSVTKEAPYPALVKEVLMMWPECKMVHGKPRHSQSQGSDGTCQQGYRSNSRMLDEGHNSTQWSQGLRFVQKKKNTRFHSGIGRTPYEAMYGQKARLGVDATSVPEEVLDGMQTEEQLAEALGVVNEVTDTGRDRC